MSEDWVVRYKNRLLQLERQSQHWAPSRSRVLVRENEAGQIAIHYREQRLPFREVQRASTARSEGRGAAPSPAPPSPKPSPYFSRQTSSLAAKKISGHDDTNFFFGYGETTTRGHFYCGQTGDTSLSLSRNSWRKTPVPRLSCGSFDDLKSEIGGFPFEIVDLQFAVLGLVKLRSSVNELHPVAQHAIDQSGQLGRHSLNGNGSPELGSQSAKLRSQIGIA